MQINYKKLHLRIIEKYDSQKEFAKVLGVTPNTVSRKMRQKVELSREEIIKWCKLLDISHEEIPSYFFAIEVQ